MVRRFVHRALAGIFGWTRSIQKPPALGVQIAQPIGLKPIRQNAKQKMPGQVRGRSPPECIVPTGLKATNIEIAQARDLDVDVLLSGGAGATFTGGMSVRLLGASIADRLPCYRRRFLCCRHESRRSSWN